MSFGTVVRGVGSTVGGKFNTPFRKALPLGAAIGAAGIYSQHPLRPATQAAQEELLGDPNGLRIAARAAFSSSMDEHFMTSAERSRLNRVSHSRPSSRMSPGVDGQIVFGMYNSRLGGP